MAVRKTAAPKLAPKKTAAKAAPKRKASATTPEPPDDRPGWVYDPGHPAGGNEDESWGPEPPSWYHEPTGEYAKRRPSSGTKKAPAKGSGWTKSTASAKKGSGWTKSTAKKAPANGAFLLAGKKTTAKPKATPSKSAGKGQYPKKSTRSRYV